MPEEISYPSYSHKKDSTVELPVSFTVLLCIFAQQYGKCGARSGSPQLYRTKYYSKIYFNKITREMQSINGASLRVLNSSIERIVLKTFES